MREGVCGRNVAEGDVRLPRFRGTDWPGRGSEPPSVLQLIARRLRAARPVLESRYKINTCFAKTDFDLSTPELVKLDRSC